jgi:hypothetical protein
MPARSARTRKSWRSTPREVAALRSDAILRAITQVLEGAVSRRSWQAFELEWFLRRLDEARISLHGAPPAVRIGFVDDLRTSYRNLRASSDDRSAVGDAARLMADALSRLFDELEDRVASPLETSEDIYAAADRIRRAGGVPFFNRGPRTVDRLPKAKVIAGSVWVIHQDPSDRSYALSHAPSGTKVTHPLLTKRKLEELGRYLAEELPEIARDAPLIHALPGGPLGTRLIGGIESREVMRAIQQALDRAMARAGISWRAA